MGQYLLSIHAVEGGPEGESMTSEEVQEFTGRIAALEAEMDASGTFVFGGHLHGPDASTVVDLDSKGGEPIMTDGPFVESKEHIAGFYIINADDLDAALAWAGKVVDALGKPIEVRPFAASGRVKG